MYYKDEEELTGIYRIIDKVGSFILIVAGFVMFTVTLILISNL